MMPNLRHGLVKEPPEALEADVTASTAPRTVCPWHQQKRSGLRVILGLYWGNIIILCGYFGYIFGLGFWGLGFGVLGLKFRVRDLGLWCRRRLGIVEVSRSHFLR